ncbi:heterokaryon incompatibility protein-domain-containing protein [Xylariaceae sp. AK1471]|nr:heterokaryon incompatibility protein-domain-containing protein [Xylariaceae sp. AK1471]
MDRNHRLKTSSDRDQKPSFDSHIQSPYRYIQGDFRLVTILAGQWNDDIKCVVSDAWFRHNTGYKALSYAWGASKSKRPIQLRGNHFDDTASLVITVNLEHALRTLRLTDKPVIMWIDALCINQEDIAERNKQVERMRDIYESADEVIVFLGNPHQHEYKRYSYPQSMHRKICFPNNDYSMPKEDRFRPGRPVTASDVFGFLSLAQKESMHADILAQVTYDENGRFKELFEGLRHMSNSPWWSRVWVVQEAVFPKKITLVYGDVTSSWEFLSEVVDAWERTKLHDLMPSEYGKVIGRIIRLVKDITRNRELYRAPLSGNESRSLLGTLRDFSYRKATDDRDKVYALLGLFQGRTDIRPDYSITVTEVYSATILDILKHDDGSLRALAGDLGRKATYGLPSWVPDWTVVFDSMEARRVSLLGLYQTAIKFESIVCTSVSDWKLLLNAHLAECDAARESLGRTWRNIDERILIIEKDLSLLHKPSDDFKMTQGVTNTNSKYEFREAGEGPDSLVKESIESVRRSFTEMATEVLNAKKDVYPFPLKTAIYASQPGILSILGLNKDILLDTCPPLYPLGLESTSEEVAQQILNIITWLKKRTTDQDLNEIEFMRALVSDLTYSGGKFQRIQDDTQLDALKDWFISTKGGHLNATKTQIASHHNDYDYVFMTANTRRSFFMTEGGRFGWGPASAKNGDAVFILPSGNTPFLLRPKKYINEERTTTHYQLVGDCFLQGAMDWDAGWFKRKIERLNRCLLDDVGLSFLRWFETLFTTRTDLIPYLLDKRPYTTRQNALEFAERNQINSERDFWLWIGSEGNHALEKEIEYKIARDRADISRKEELRREEERMRDHGKLLRSMARLQHRDWRINNHSRIYIE